jgi:hypothetical protein
MIGAISGAFEEVSLYNVSLPQRSNLQVYESCTLHVIYPDSNTGPDHRSFDQNFNATQPLY